MAIWVQRLPAALALGAGEGAAQDHLIASDQGSTVTITEASFNNIMSTLEELKAAVGSREKADGWEDTSEEKWKVKFGGRVMADYVTFANQDPGYGGANTAQNYLEARRARFRAEGDGYGVYFWQIELDFAADDDSSAQYNAGGPGLRPQ